jgi:mannose-1-phosphate guanylyltransferase
MRETLMRRTIDRAARLIPTERLVTVLVRGQSLPGETERQSLPGETERRPVPDVLRIVQPRYRGSAAEVFLPVLQIARRDPHAIVVILPGDHDVGYETRFLNYVAKAAAAVDLRPDLPVLIGAHPQAPDLAHAWIEPGEPMEGLEHLEIRAVRRFIRRPPAPEIGPAAEGRGLLSTLVLSARARTLIDLGVRHLPDVLETLEPLEDAFGAPEESLLREAIYECMPYAHISELLGHGESLAVLPLPDLTWGEHRPPLGLLAS